MAPSDESLEIRQAREFVQSIAEKRGFLPEEVWHGMNPSNRTRIQNAMLSLQEQTASSVETLAKNLYTSGERFIFELLQNCDDNHYIKARSRDEPPWVTFRVYPNQIIVECNEDGFTEANITAISSTGQSSKAGQHGYVGAKGIGFKSVFMAAWKVHIRSGPFSFYFEHHKGDKGLGMITPQWLVPDDDDADFPHGLTRITLFLHDDDGPFQRNFILDQLRNLEGSTMLFMQNLKKIQIIFFMDAVPGRTSTTTFRATTEGPDRVRISKVETRNGKTVSSSQLYHIIKHMATGLAKHDDRDYTEEDEAAQVYSRSQVVLGFPLTEDSTPLIKPQNVFAFLPIRHMGFSFLIQADFVTQANRQDIVRDSPRNRGLLKGIAEAFSFVLVNHFIAHPALQYTWMRFVPQAASHHYDSYWKSLVDTIGSKIKRLPLVERWTDGDGNGDFFALEDARPIEAQHWSTANKPLFLDLSPGIYLARKYSPDDVQILHALGMPRLSASDIIDLLEANLTRVHSLADAYSSYSQWCSGVTQLLLSLFDEEATTATHVEARARLKAISLIPTRDKGWHSQVSGLTIYFPTTDGVDIPTAPGLTILADWAAQNESYSRLCQRLCVSHATIQLIRRHVLEDFHAQNPAPVYTISHWNAQLVYLYLTDHLVIPRDDLSKVRVVTTKNHAVRPFEQDVYLSCHGDDYGPQELFKAMEADETRKDAVPAHDATFLWDIAEPKRPANASSWASWLSSRCRIVSTVPLLTKTHSDPKFSAAFHHVQEHRPEKLMGFLQRGWRSDGQRIEQSPTLLEELRDTSVLVHVFSDGSRLKRSLSSTYLPLPHLKEECARYVPKDEMNFFPFLKLDRDLDSSTYGSDWGFATKFAGVGDQSDTKFLIQLLVTAGHYNPSRARSQDDANKIIALYVALHGRACNLLTDEERKLYRELIKTWMIESCIALILAQFIGDSEPPRFGWFRHTDCRWEAPVGELTKYISLPNTTPAFKSGPHAERLRSFFCEYVGIVDCNLSDVVEELSEQRNQADIDFELVDNSYRYLDRLRKKGSKADLEEIKNAFRDHELIYDPNTKTWHKISNSLWASDRSFRGQACLKDKYKDLNTFFVHFLGITSPTFGVVYKELVRLGESDNPDPAAVKDKFHHLNALVHLAKDEKYFVLWHLPIFPVRDRGGPVHLVKLTTSFAIVDRQPLADKFGSKACLLDFAFDDFRRMESLWKWLRLTSRYLSTQVRTVSTVDESDKRVVKPTQLNMASKAHALYRLARHYGTFRFDDGDNEAGHELLKLLYDAQVYTSRSISTQLHLLQDDDEPIVVDGDGNLHMTEQDNQLRIFVPRRKKDWETCLSYEFPDRIFSLLMRELPDNDEDDFSRSSEIPKDGWKLVSQILNTSHRVLRKALADWGIADVDIEDSYVEEEEEDDNDSSTDEEEDDYVQTPISSIPGRSRASPPSPPRASEHNRAIALAVRTRQSTPSSRPSSSPGLEEARTPERALHHLPGSYGNLLRQVTEVASRGVLCIPPQGSAICDASDPAGSRGWEAGIDQLTRDKMVGAAGELLVFHLLSESNHRLPSFNLYDWRSTIRHFVRAHPDYENIAAWSGRETSDFVYEDIGRSLTRELIAQGYLDSDLWSGAKPRYFIEVKATTGHCGTAFYMSKAQYQRMERLHGNQDEVYVIFRVFGLGRDRIGLRVYADPWRAKLNGELVFACESYTVTPT